MIDALHFLIIAIYVLHASYLTNKLRQHIRRADKWRQDALSLNSELHSVKRKLQANIISTDAEKVA
jgi:hypothetical protein